MKTNINGKGSKPRKVNIKKWDKNYSLIKWKSKNVSNNK